MPIGLSGTEIVWPRKSRLPDILEVPNPPTVRIHVGDRVDLKDRSADADSKRIMSAIAGVLPT